MDNPAALHRIKVGVPATVEHSSDAGPETSKWVAETTQVSISFRHRQSERKCFDVSKLTEFHHFHGRVETSVTSEGPASSYSSRIDVELCEV